MLKNNMRIVRDLDVLRFKSGDQTWFAARTVTPIVGTPLTPHYSIPTRFWFVEYLLWPVMMIFPRLQYGLALEFDEL